MNVANLVGVKLGNFRLERLLGSGRMGVVYLARDEALLRPTAVKILSWSMPEQPGLDPETWFLAEARNVARINHPHVIQIYGVAKHGSRCYIAMEYVAGVAADIWVKEHGPLSPTRATEILLQAAGALQAAHDARVIHRDVKPGNLLITPDGTAKLGDFGMAMSVHTNAGAEVIRAGTPFYTAPEIWNGRYASPATDLYALGATYFYLLTGRPPFDATTPEQLMNAHLMASVPDPREFAGVTPCGCHELIQRCMAKSPQDRYPSAEALSWEVRGLVRELVSVPPAARHSTPIRGTEVALSSAPPGRDLEFFRFAMPPFQSIDPLDPPSVGEPFCSVEQALHQAMLDGSRHNLLFTGERGSGKTTLARQLMAQYEPIGPVACLSNDEPQRFLLQQVARAFGGLPTPHSTGNVQIDGLLSELERLHPERSAPALLVIDNLTPVAKRVAELSVLMQAAAKTRYLRVLLIATPEIGERWLPASSGGEGLGLRRLQMPALTGRQTLTYIADWLRASLERDSKRPLFTPDAGLLVAHRSGGNLVRINQIAAGMLAAAAAEGRTLLSSWDAWVAPMDEAVTGTPSSARAPRPCDWPSAEVLEVLNAERSAAGMAPRQPRREVARGSSH